MSSLCQQFLFFLPVPRAHTHFFSFSQPSMCFVYTTSYVGHMINLRLCLHYTPLATAHSVWIAACRGEKQQCAPWCVVACVSERLWKVEATGKDSRSSLLKEPFTAASKGSDREGGLSAARSFPFGEETTQQWRAGEAFPH